MSTPCPPERKQTLKKKTQIYGRGYGDWHTWEKFDYARVGSAPAEKKWSLWECAVCGALFRHYYDLEPDIFVAMKKELVPASCERKEADK